MGAPRVRGGQQRASTVDPVGPRLRRLVLRRAVGQDLRERGKKAAHGYLRRGRLAKVQRRDELEKAAKPRVTVLRVVERTTRIEDSRFAQQVENGPLELKPKLVPKFAGPRAAAM